MLDKEEYPELDDELLTSNEKLTRFSKARDKIVGRVKGSELPSIQGPQYFEEDIVVRERVTSRTERPSVRGPGTNENHYIIGQAQNDGSSDSQDILAAMKNVRP